MRRSVAMASTRAAVLDDAEIDQRVETLLVLLLMGVMDAYFAGDAQSERQLRMFPLTVAILDVRKALSCYQRHIEPPAAKLPRATELANLTDGGLDAVWKRYMGGDPS